MKSKSFGFELGSSTIKGVWLEGSTGVFRLYSCVVFPSPSHGMASESPLDQEEMAQAIKQLTVEGKITSKSAHIALADNQVFTKVIEMPMLSEKELASAITWEAEQYIPAALTTMSLDHIVLKQTQTASGPRMLVLLVAAPKALISRYQQILGMAGVSVASVETEILSIVRSALPNGFKPTAFLLHVGSLSSSFAIIQEGIVIFTYAIPIGSLAIDRAVASDFGFSLNQAEEYKRTYGITGSNESGKIGKAIEPILSSIISETKKALVYYQNKYRNEFPIQQLILSGSTAHVPGIIAYFAEQCGITASIHNPFAVQKITGVPEEIMDNAAEFGTVVGLSLKDYE
jgi:type IV pilus assembly protein PilM